MLQLLQFRHSPYNEKVRWALDIKRLPHRRRSLLPGPHIGVIKPLTGQTGTPVLTHDDGKIAGSARIVQWLDERYPTPRLIPEDDALREEALRIERWFDEELTPRVRRPVLAALLRQPGYFARIFGDGARPAKRFAYACMVPLAAPLVRKGNGIAGKATIDDGLRAATEALDFVAERSAATGYLCGAAFSIADITAAAALATIVRPPDSPMRAPEPVASATRELIARYAQHPGAAWVRAIYARHRGARSDFDGLAPYGAIASA